jgi:hypothetical protein
VDAQNGQLRRELEDVDEANGRVTIDFDKKDGSGERFVAVLTDEGLRINDSTLWTRAR